ncbi:MAG: SIMPL domain-containing protein [Patescibacteria group bacterium]
MLSSIRTPLFTILFVFICLFMYTTLFGPIPFSVNSITTNKQNLFSVSGAGKASAVPNTAQISIGVTKSAPTVESAQQQSNTITNQIITDLKNLGIEEKNITTSNYSVSPNYDYSGGRQTMNGYTVTQNLEIKISPIERASSAIDIATRNGANVIGGVQFVLDDKTKRELLRKAREEAVNEAKEKAKELSSITGIRLGKIIDVQENTSEPGRMMQLSADLKVGGGGEPTQLAPGESTIQITITLSYETL